MNFLSSALCIAIDAPLFPQRVFMPDISRWYKRMTFQETDLTAAAIFTPDVALF